MNKFFNAWLKNFCNAWEQRHPEKAAKLFSKGVEYYESVFEQPCKNWDEVYDLWKVVPENHKDVDFNYEIILTRDDIAVVNWQVKRTLLPSNEKQKIDGIFVIRLNKDGLCNYFKQWRSEK